MFLTLILIHKPLEFIQQILIGEETRAVSASQVYDAKVDLCSALEFIHKTE